MDQDTVKIIAKAKQLGGAVTHFEQKDGNCGGWVSRWIRKILMEKMDSKKKGLWDDRYFATEVLSGTPRDPEWAKKGDIPTVAKGFLMLKKETELGTKKAEDLMARQRATQAMWDLECKKRKKEYSNYRSLADVFRDLKGGLPQWYMDELTRLAELAKSTPESSGWMKGYITKATKAGKQTPIKYVKYTKDNGDFRKGKIGENAEGLKRLHEHCHNKIAFIGMDKPGHEGHAVGMHRLSFSENFQGKTFFFDPNYGMFGLRKEVFNDWLEFWFKTAVGYSALFEKFHAKVFERVEMAEPPATERPKLLTKLQGAPRVARLYPPTS